MPEVFVKYPKGLFAREEKAAFKRGLKASVAQNMEAIDPATGDWSRFRGDVNGLIDLTMVAIEADDFEGTAACLVTVTTYGWPDRMANIDERTQYIVDDVRGLVPAANTDDRFLLEVSPADAISVTFVEKGKGCWSAG